MDALQYIQQIGSVVGVPASVFLAWVWFKVNNNERDIKELKSESALLKQTLSDIKSDVSFIRGRLSKDNKDV